MSDTRVKRTYNLSEATVRAVRELADRGYGSSQDAIVERAVQELAWRIQDEEETRLWEQAAKDPVFQAEARRLEVEFGDFDAANWPPE